MPTKVDFIVADRTCKFSGGNLVSLSSYQDKTVLKEIVQSLNSLDPSVTQVWIGGYNFLDYGKWKWTDGTNFKVDVPESPGFNCISFDFKEETLRPTECFHIHAFVCARKSSNDTSSTAGTARYFKAILQF
uniref:C-type lectin domain-containing protein n=1 Tax=Steinernema glaseri TaxID=37863 RepID=A0A1I7YDP8_9BILA